MSLSEQTTTALTWVIIAKTYLSHHQGWMFLCWYHIRSYVACIKSVMNTEMYTCCRWWQWRCGRADDGDGIRMMRDVDLHHDKSYSSLVAMWASIPYITLCYWTSISSTYHNAIMLAKLVPACIQEMLYIVLRCLNKCKQFNRKISISSCRW